MIATSVVGEEFAKACEFWKNNTKGANMEPEMEKLERTSPTVAAIVEQALKKNMKA